MDWLQEKSVGNHGFHFSPQCLMVSCRFSLTHRKICAYSVFITMFPLKMAMSGGSFPLSEGPNHQIIVASMCAYVIMPMHVYTCVYIYIYIIIHIRIRIHTDIVPCTHRHTLYPLYHRYYRCDTAVLLKFPKEKQRQLPLLSWRVKVVRWVRWGSIIRNSWYIIGECDMVIMLDFL